MDDETTRVTIEAVKRLDAAFESGDIDAFMAAMTDDCVWDLHTCSRRAPPRRLGGGAAKAMTDFLDSSPVFDGEEMLACGDRAAMRLELPLQ